MKVEYSRRALEDIRKITADCCRAFGGQVASALLGRIENAVARICENPESGPRVEQRRDVRVLSLVRYPYRIFYRVGAGTVTILHIRHTSRRAWQAPR
jgi:toxin ParE1/3/4